MVTQQFLQERFIYHQDGHFIYRKNGKRAIASRSKNSKALKINLFRKPTRLHRMIFLYHHGYLPEFIDHINGDFTDNRIENLRPATISENNLNKSKARKNTSGYKNVSLCKRTGKWRVILTINRKYTYLGVFDEIELADLVATEARNLYHGAFARHH